MKNIFFLLFLIGCSNPAELKVSELDTSQQEQVDPPEPPVFGVIANEDCSHVNVGDKACNLRLLDQNGEIWELYDLIGNVVVLDFSTSWCGPCQTVGHYLQPLQDDYQSMDVSIVTILIDGYVPGTPPSEYDMNDWVSSHNVTSVSVLQGARDLVMDPTGVEGYIISSFPTFFYIDRNMKFYSGHSGYNDQYVREKIDEAL
tara:strand:+ start:631 stop:1233 length:603 start_codon:yes stop_codon:yes gene_type:complete